MSEGNRYWLSERAEFKGEVTAEMFNKLFDECGYMPDTPDVIWLHKPQLTWLDRLLIKLHLKKYPKDFFYFLWKKEQGVK
jgi:hypothetical protein